MRIPRSSSGLIISLLLVAAVMAAAPAKTQAPAPPVLGKEAAAIQQNGAKIGQIAKQYVPPAATQAVLTLTPITQTAQPNQSVHFDLTWSRPVYRYSYHFDWGDGKTNDVTELSADHSYDSPQTYTVRVTATPLANVKMAMMMKPVAILSNAVSVAVVLPEQQTLTLDSDKLSINVGDTVTLTATLNPSAPDAQYQFNFDDGSTASSVTTNQVAHPYNAERTYYPTVTVLTNDGQQSVTSPAVEIRVTIPPAVIPPPAPKLTVRLASRGNVIAGGSVTVAASLDRPQKRMSYEFDWGDGSAPETVGAKGVAVHRYATAGLHEVVVTAETEEAYVPPVHGILQVTIEKKPPPTWLLIAIVGVAIVLVVGLVKWLKRPRPPTSTLHIRFVPHNDWVDHELKMGRRTRTLGSFKISSGMGPAEYKIEFPGDTTIASEEAELERSHRS